MKKTPLDILTILYKLLFASSLKTAITGSVYKQKRPTGSVLEDVVVNSLPVSGDQLQRGAGNVNIYVPDLLETVAGTELRIVDTARLKVLAELAVPLLTEFNCQQYRFWLGPTDVFEEPDTGQTYLNFRIEFQFFP
ncbi:hypothetical protein EXU85_20355 [Spirosoma sp. KCTC 42546]|uniref:hypothetical protein n=1 Tax=Spirosoma sp. KCTC 42546 TaxID=2520506 RepID=UPI001157AFAA|nr:hypothetical protein [Spirosoma sp. KCTC 42546]QDK80832.1 hypothetical protein EXU85_20355 [Spirosoma sp. KCTC 42546]